MADVRRLGKYEIRGTLGQGAMGVVYHAFDPVIERQVALKTIRVDLAGADYGKVFMARFRNEAKAAGRLHHPNIVGVYEYGEDADVAFIAMEYVEGLGLSDHVAGRPDFDFRGAATLVEQLLAALEYAHDCGVVHRDIKPSNLLVTKRGALKVADFGVARVDTTRLTATGMIIGTPSYMSPEQCRGGEADARSDLFSTGIVLYELLTGQRPFRGPSESIAYMICHEQPAPPSQQSLQSLPAGFDALVATALAKDPAQRFASARDFAFALREVIRTSPAADPDPDATRVPPATHATPPVHGATPNNLPPQVTSFVGRERELADIARMLASARLVTIIGAGGLGKTRLALQVAAGQLSEFPDGAWLVELAPLSEPRLVVQAVAATLGVTEEPGVPLAAALQRHVKDRRLLLILDNCEHLLQACAEVAKLLLLAAPALRMLATSREPLHVAGETVCPLHSLSVPDARAAQGPGTLQRFDAVRLFAARAMAGKPTFELNAQNAAAVATICQRLDGIPLALELAAARVRTLSLDAIAQRLNDRFHLLTSGDQTALPRQQTLRACIDWSYELLGAPERALLASLSVFAGGFTLDAAEAVGAHRDVAAGDVLDLLSRLVDKSLVAMDTDGERYRLLETVRQYAQERLAASGQGDDARRRHLAYYLAMGEAADPKLMGDEQETWHARLDADRENLLAAIGFAAGLPDAAQEGLRLVHSIRMWLRRLSMELASRFVTEALARDGAQERNLVRVDAIGTAASFCYFQGRYDEARRLAEEGLALAREQGDPLRTADGLALVGLAAIGQGDPGAARHVLDEAVALSRDVGDRNRLQQSLNCLAEACAAAGDLDAAEPMYEEALTLARDIGGRDTIAVALLNLARVHLDRNASDSARRVLREVLELVDAHAGPQETQQLLTVAAGLAAHDGDWARAARIYGAAQAQLKQHGLRREPADEASLAPLMARARQAIDNAGFAAGEAEGRAMTPDEVLRDVKAWLHSGA